jgi:hypothetical protein
MKNLKCVPFLSILCILSCKNAKENKVLETPKEVLKELTFTAEAAPEWTALMERTSGWFAADGIFTIPLDGKETQNIDGKETLFIFSDTYVGEVQNGVPKPGNIMVNNTTAWMKGNKPQESAIEFEYNTDENGLPKSYFIPNNVLARDKEYYWLGDGFVNQEKDNALYIFAYHVHKTGPNVFDFEQTNISLLKVEKPTKEGIKTQTQIPTKLGFVHEATQKRAYFGCGIFVNTKEANAPNPDGYVYIYGVVEGNKSLVAARTLPRNIENFERYTYWNGSSWVSDKQQIVSLADGVSNELSVTPTGDGRYLLTFQVLGISDKVGIKVGESPVGPFGKLNEVYTTPEYTEKNLLPYNAKAHYHLSKPGELLISCSLTHIRTLLNSTKIFYLS